jgi:hypothetical protein
MLYLFTGSDSAKVGQKVAATIASLRAKKPDASVVAVSEVITPELADELIGGQGLFERKLIISLNGAFSGDEGDELLGRLAEMQASENIFLAKEPVLSKKVLEKIEKYSEKIFTFDLAPSGPKANDFEIANAIERRDKKTTWMLLIEAYERGSAPEALHGMLFWKFKTLLTKKSFRTFSEIEIRILLKKLVIIYHESRRGKTSLPEALEEFVLSV